MKNQKKVVCVIPARLASTRFPRKMLASLADRPLLSWVWDAANKTGMFDEVIFAVDSQEIADTISSFDGKSILTSLDCKSGTDRLVELMSTGKVNADVWVNSQGDEPFVTKPMIEALLQTIDNPNEEAWTLKKLIQNQSDIFSPKMAKVVCDQQGFALYFSRAPIPFFRDEQDPATLVAKHVYFKHVGLYAYTTSALQKIATMASSQCEDAEKLEQLRLLDYGLKIRVHETDTEVFGIDTPEDLANAEKRVQTSLSFR